MILPATTRQGGAVPPPRRRFRCGWGPLCLPLLWGFAGCGDPSPLPEPTPDEIAPAPAAIEPPPQLPPALSEEQIGSMTLQIPGFGEAPVRFRDGQFEDPMNRRIATLTPAPRAVADFDGDGAPEVALVIMTSSGGPELGAHLVAVGGAGGRAVPEGILSLGEGVRVVEMTVQGFHLRVGLTGPGAGEGVRRDLRYRLTGGVWTQVDR